MNEQFPKFELLTYSLSFSHNKGEEFIRGFVDMSIEFIMNVLKTDESVSYYQEYLKDQHTPLWNKLSERAVDNKTTVEEYTKHFIADFVKKDPSVSYNVSLNHFLLDEDIKLILEGLGYLNSNDLLASKFDIKALYRDTGPTDVPPCLAEKNPVPSMPYNMGN